MLQSWCRGVRGRADGVRWSQRQKRKEERSYHDMFVADLEHIQVELKENIAQAQERYWKNVDKHRAEAPKLNIGNQAYVKAKFFRTRQPSKKLLEKNLGPYDIIGKLGTHSITLHLPHQLCSVHPVFHMSQLEPA